MNCLSTFAVQNRRAVKFSAVFNSLVTLFVGYAFQFYLLVFLRVSEGRYNELLGVGPRNRGTISC